MERSFGIAISTQAFWLFFSSDKKVDPDLKVIQIRIQCAQRWCEDQDRFELNTRGNEAHPVSGIIHFKIICNPDSLHFDKRFENVLGISTFLCCMPFWIACWTIAATTAHVPYWPQWAMERTTRRWSLTENHNNEHHKELQETKKYLQICPKHFNFFPSIVTPRKFREDQTFPRESHKQVNVFVENCSP